MIVNVYWVFGVKILDLISVGLVSIAEIPFNAERLPGSELLISADFSTLRNQAAREHGKTVCIVETIRFPMHSPGYL